MIDFGVAKATGQQLTDKTLFTGFGQMVGTPLYMSPEQAEVQPARHRHARATSTRLGVLLYELLTGTTPLRQGSGCSEAAFDEMLRIIREEEPPQAEHAAEHVDGHAAVDRRPTGRPSRRKLTAAGARRARLDRDEGPGEGPQPPYERPTAWRATSSATCTTSRCRPARRRLVPLPQVRPAEQSGPRRPGGRRDAATRCGRPRNKQPPHCHQTQAGADGNAPKKISYGPGLQSKIC